MLFAPLVSLALAAGACAAPLAARQLDTNTLADICDQIDGTVITDELCQTASGSDITVAAATSSGLALVTVSGGGLLEGSSITVPVTSLQSILDDLGITSLDPTKRALEVDLGAANISLRRALEVDLGAANISLKKKNASRPDA